MFKANIIINTYDGNQDDLVRAVESCLNQNGCEIKLIVSTVDGDPSLETLKAFDVNIVTSKKPGIYPQLNRALEELTEEWWCYMSGNDIAYPDKLRLEIEACLKNNAKICYSAYDLYVASSRRKKLVEFPEYDFDKHLGRNYVADVATMHKSVSDEYGPFSSEVDNMGYWEFWLRVGRDHPEYFVYNPIPTFKYIVSKDSRHVKRKRDLAWRKRELEDRVKMLSKFGPLKGVYAKYSRDFSPKKDNL